MSYIANTHINSTEGARTFFRYLITERHVSLHPDDDFSNYAHNSADQPFFTTKETTLYSRLMEESFTACRREGIDIYGIGLQETQTCLSA